MKKLTLDDLKKFRDHLRIPVTDEQLEKDLYQPPYFHPGSDAPEIKYMMDRRAELGGAVPERRSKHQDIALPDAKTYEVAKRGSGKQQAATTMAFVRLLKDLMRDKNFGKHIAPIIPDEARTFGMDAFFPTAKIYNPKGQNYLSVDRDLVLAYKESAQGQLIHPGINEAGAVAAFTAAGTAYATHGVPLIPIYVFYSMFGFQRTGDAFWAAGDQMARGFIIGATAGRTTLTGEGLQHADGHSPLLASTNPAVVTYDPAYGYEMGHIMRDGIERMYGPDSADRNLMYYLTVYNEPITQPAEPEDLDVEGVLKGIYLVAPAKIDGPRTQILASGVSVPWAIEAQRHPGRGVGRFRGRLVRHLLERTAPRRHGRRGRSLPEPRPARPCSVRDPAARGCHRSRRCRLGLHEGRPGPDPPVCAERIRHARRGRLRLLRHPGSSPPLLQERHPLHRGPFPGDAGAPRGS